jgi:predicted Zn finger-like uncharacterized protein
MLLTRCPECDTTFRVTDETLKKASGQVRCGRCASVFNAYAELHNPGAKSAETEQPRAARANPAAAAPQAPDRPQPAPTAAAVSATLLRLETKPAEPAATGIGSASMANVVAEAKVAAADAAAEAPTAAESAANPLAISATEVDRVLATPLDEPVPPLVYAWARGEQPPRSRWWTAAAALALLVLGAQAIHHFRSDIAGHATVGPWLTATYKTLGSELTPRWDVDQYEIIDWIATAEPNSRGIGSLKITARIQNRGPSRQPYPAVQLRLKDRWEAAIGSRMFAPAEYLPRDTPRERLMSPGETARAEIEVVDPGPDAYGFELDVCIEVEASLVTCGGDEVFL